MEEIKQFGIAVCSASIFCAAFGILFPQNGYRKILKIALGVFFILTILIPAKNAVSAIGEIDFSAYESDYSYEYYANENSLGGKAAELMKGYTENAVRQSLSEISVEPREIEIIMDIDRNGSISIGQVIVTLSESDYPKGDEIQSLLKNRLGITASIKNGG
ncbi:MAG: stage III sporulation protein AF [Oscillospiraceae bacterium]|jgi:hypothetical protein|nr:stage III sporulation protein AF [Oscillospiraceae bacterium]